MSSLSSASTRVQIEAAYDDSASYAEDNDAAKAKLFVTACRLLIRIYRNNIEHLGGTRVETEVRLFQDQIKAAQQWLALTNGGEGGAGVRFSDFTNFRS